MDIMDIDTMDILMHAVCIARRTHWVTALHLRVRPVARRQSTARSLARMQHRKGPGILAQPAWEASSSCWARSAIVPAAAARVACTWRPPVLGLASLVVTVLFIPIGGLQAFAAGGDAVVVLYLLTIPTLAIILGGSASGSPYAGVGASRTMVVRHELRAPAHTGASSPSASAAAAALRRRDLLAGPDNAWSSISPRRSSFDWRLIPAAVAMLLVIPCEVGQPPFDVGEAETEICEGPLAEYSGAPLAVFKLSHAIKMFVMTALL